MLLGVVTIALLVFVYLSIPANAEGSTFTVNSTADTGDPTPANGVCHTSAGECTLRAAIQTADKHSGPDTIAFGIPGEGVHTIHLTRKLPNLTDKSGPTTIDGYTQPGSSPNTDPLVSNAQIMVQIEGVSYDPALGGFDGLHLDSADNVVRGLAFYQLVKSIRLNGTDVQQNRIVGNFIGTNAAGSYGVTQHVKYSNGVHIAGGAHDNIIGGTSPEDRNVISGNSGHGVGMYQQSTTAPVGSHSNLVQGNLIGLTPSGTARLPNKAHGVDMNGGIFENVVGGTLPGERNVISGNTGEGVEFSHGSSTNGVPTANEVVGNFIGTDVTGQQGPAYARNGGHGVNFQDNIRYNIAHDNIIGNSGMDGVSICCRTALGNKVYDNWIGVTPGGVAIPNVGSGVRMSSNAQSSLIQNNVIANNSQGGVVVNGTSTDFNTITHNSIYNNVGLGIDIQPLGAINPNDAGDADTGANEQLNFPVLQSATSAAVIGTACANCTVEVFIADSGAGANGEGKSFIGSAVAGADGAFAVPVSGGSAGDYVTATVTDASGNTSEFSRNVVVSG